MTTCLGKAGSIIGQIETTFVTVLSEGGELLHKTCDTCDTCTAVLLTRSLVLALKKCTDMTDEEMMHAMLIAIEISTSLKIEGVYLNEPVTEH